MIVIRLLVISFSGTAQFAGSRFLLILCYKGLFLVFGVASFLEMTMLSLLFIVQGTAFCLIVLISQDIKVSLHL